MTQTSDNYFMKDKKSVTNAHIVSECAK